MISFLIVVILGPIFIPMLTKFKFGQTVRDDGPKTHLAKNGTPTMGGILMIVAILITGLTRSKVGPDMVIGLICIFGFGLIGFIDDFIIIKKRRSLGLKPWQKIVMQFGLALYVANYQYTVSASAPQLMVPFTDIAINLGPLYVPIMIFVIVGTVNAVNLTDGLDGLATSVTIIVLTFFAIVGYKTGNVYITTFSLALIGALIGFLKFNAFPAKIFMGDTGSLALGGAIGTMALMLKMELLVIIVGGIYVFETLSVIIQVTSFKLTGKRVFKMAPVHHHFEQLGWSEVKIVTVFSIITAILCVIGFIAI